MVTQSTTQEDANGWECQHALSLVSNVIVEAWACSYGVKDSGDHRDRHGCQRQEIALKP